MNFELNEIQFGELNDVPAGSLYWDATVGLALVIGDPVAVVVARREINGSEHLWTAHDPARIGDRCGFWIPAVRIAVDPKGAFCTEWENEDGDGNIARRRGEMCLMARTTHTWRERIILSVNNKPLDDALTEPYPGFGFKIWSAVVGDGEKTRELMRVEGGRVVEAFGVKGWRP